MSATLTLESKCCCGSSILLLPRLSFDVAVLPRSISVVIRAPTADLSQDRFHEANEVLHGFIAAHFVYCHSILFAALSSFTAF
jgi:hypothetical protein